MTLPPATHHGPNSVLTNLPRNANDQSADFVIEEDASVNNFPLEILSKGPTIIHLGKDLNSLGYSDSSDSHRGILSSNNDKTKKERQTISFSNSLELRVYKVGSLATDHDITKCISVKEFKSEQRTKSSRIPLKSSKFSWSGLPIFNDHIMDAGTLNEECERGATHFTDSYETFKQADNVTTLTCQQKHRMARISNNIEIELGDGRIVLTSQASLVSIWAYILWSFLVIPFQCFHGTIQRLLGRQNQPISEVAGKDSLAIFGDAFVDLEV